MAVSDPWITEFNKGKGTVEDLPSLELNVTLYVAR
jgi:hypothetical protein